MKLVNNRHIVLNFFLTIFAIIYLFKIEGDLLSYNSYYEQPVQDDIELVSDDYNKFNLFDYSSFDLSQVEKCSLNNNYSKPFSELYIVYYKNKISTIFNTSLNSNFTPSQTYIYFRQIYSFDNSSDELPPHIV